MTNLFHFTFVFVLTLSSENQTFQHRKMNDLLRNDTYVNRVFQVVDFLNTLHDLKNNVSLPFEETKHPNICLTKECISSSNDLFKNMDLNSDPCEDFNQFACGNFIKERSIPDDKGRISNAFTPTRDLRKMNKMISDKTINHYDKIYSAINI